MSGPVYCNDCDKELSEGKGEYAHGCLDCHGTVPSDKLFWLRKELATKDAIIKELKAMGSFYGNMQNWRDTAKGFDSGEMLEIEQDAEAHLGLFWGGKRARECLRKIEEMEGR